MNGLILVDKPGGCTSHDVVNRLRKLSDTKSIGHLGTLDPMATGLLALLIGKATRLAQFLDRATKTYEAEVLLGFTSDSYDVEGEMSATGARLPKELDQIEHACEAFRGRFLQVPPAVSAKKVNGVRAYKLAREKAEVTLAPVPVEITRLEIDGFDGQRFRLLVKCSAGTYIRSLAHDLGAKLGCGAVLSGLRRTAIGDLRVADAFTLDRLKELSEAGQFSNAIHPASALIPEFPAVHVDELTEAHIRQGRNFRVSPFVSAPGTPRVKAVNRSGELVAIGSIVLPNLYHPDVVF